MVKQTEAQKGGKKPGSTWVPALAAALGFHSLVLLIPGSNIIRSTSRNDTPPHTLEVRLSDDTGPEYPPEKTPQPHAEPKTEAQEATARDAESQPAPEEAPAFSPVESPPADSLPALSDSLRPVTDPQVLREVNSGGSSPGTLAPLPSGWVLEMPAYPPASRRFRQTGSVVVEFKITLEGAVTDAKITRSSGHGLLDRAALETVSRKWSFPPQPKELWTAREFRFLLSGVE